MNNESHKTFNILSIDGGGIRGTFPLHILNCIQEKLSINLSDYFDLVVGTSTGSIVAAAVALNLDLNKILSIYKTHGSEIFPGNAIKNFPLIKLSTVISRKYSSKPLLRLLKENIGEITLGEIKRPALIIPATDINNGGVHVFKSQYSPDFIRDTKTKVYEAVLASCSAPLYFSPALVDNKYLLADGGLWANNPALVGYTDARKRFRKPHDEIKILSIGTGTNVVTYKQCRLLNSLRFWGFVNGWRGSSLVDLILSLQSQNIENTLNLILPKDKYMRINFKSDKDLPLDCPKSVPDLISRADKEFIYHSKELKDFLS